ncbi:hypothetical protein QBC35DRAFT_179948 [Podospora australis]|uniref:GYF domain-containing protein n=1 Tax=Podospora australis TaxID=1536484 RepID=A0AAN7AIY2_9PEZI|nr:hypothetical protein QBC35DRAFT_179948 [Podospora australis]
MPSGLPSSFASAAAGQTARDQRGNGQSNTGRGAGSGEWPRANGTRTFRRSSTTPFNPNSTSNASSTFAEGMQNSVSDMSSYSSNNQSAYADSQGDMRYTRDQLLDIYKTTDMGQIDAASLFTPTWDPSHVNGNQSSRPWGKAGETGHIPQDPTVCWDAAGNVKPINLEPMTAEERELLNGDVNSTLKPPQPKQQQQQPQDGSVQQVGGGGGGVNGRKTSVGAGNYPVASPSNSRPVTRRRETADTNPFSSAAVASPTASRFSREDSWFSRRNTEVTKDATLTDEPEEDTNPRETPSRSQPNYGLLRSNTAGSSSAFNNAGALWGPGTPTSSSGIGGGAFGNFAIPTPGTATKQFQAPASGSRLAHLIPGKEPSENSAPKALDAATWRSRPRTDTDPFTAEDAVSGSAALGGARDTSPSATAQQPPQRGGLFDTPVKGNAGDFGMAGLNLGERGDGPSSPSETNPYRSPMGDRVQEVQDDHHDTDRSTHPPGATEPHSGYSTLPRSFGATPFDGSDRSQTSSVGAKGFPTQVNPLTGWPAASVGTPDRERSLHNPFGSSIFSPLDGLPSPSIGGLGGVFGPNPNRMGRGRLESLFPPSMQAEMHAHEHDHHFDSPHEPRQANPLGAIGRGAIGLGREMTGSPIRAGRGVFDDHFAHPEASRSPFSATEQGHLGLAPTAQNQGFPATGGPSAPSAQQSSEHAAVRTMVMPDRMRWVYLDPQGMTQGPFSGLEMNDWYKANFFTPDLRVKRVEDTEFEPLGQLIRRIGNSREPFLVPQMGIPHGPPPSVPFTGGGNEPVPPLQNAFPSFGRTLTAAQQNDLERRKQEEQLLLARQREMAQTYVRFPLQTTGLHHHSSLHSLHSQPSFGSMTSPITMPPQAPIGPLAPGAFFDSGVSLVPGPVQAPIGPSTDQFPSDLNMGERQVMANIQAGGLPGVFHSQPAPNVDNGLQSQLPGIDQLQQDEEGFDVRLRQFHDIRAQRDAEDAAAAQAVQAPETHVQPVTHEEKVPVAAPAAVEPATTNHVAAPEPAAAKKIASQAQEELSLTEKVRKTQADHAKSAQQPSASGLPMPFPPPQNTPLAAPTAQRPASNLPNRYGDRSASGTPDTTSDGVPLAPPPTAPWAREPGAETHKGPSLKEIQEAEAKKAAKKEEAAAAARRHALEMETAALREREKAAAVTLSTGLPATSTWGTGSPVGAPAGSPWKQPAVVKAPVASSAASKKTLADIQREEEQRKLKAKEAAQQANAVSGAALGKRYADLASKTSAPPGMAAASVVGTAAAATAQAPVGGGWSTVGAGGKVKVPTGPAVVQNRAASTSGVKAAPSPVVAPKATPKPAQTSLKDAKILANEEFKKWVHHDLVRNGVAESRTEDIIGMLMECPLDKHILGDIVYDVSTTINCRHFAEEFIRRRKLADKGIFEKEPAASSAANDNKTSSNGGWNEVAKKGGSSSNNSSGAQAPKEDAPGFKIVPSKKNKGKK